MRLEDLIEARKRGFGAPGHVFDENASALACENTRDLEALPVDFSESCSFRGKPSYE